MVLYFLDNQCFLYQMLMHRLGCNKQKDAVLIIDKGMRISKYVKSLKDYNIFYDVIEATLLYSKRNAEDASMADYLDFFNKIFSRIPYKLESFEEICVMNDYWDGDINLYLNHNKIHYTWIETVIDCIDYRPQYVSGAFAKMMSEIRAHTPYAEFATPCILDASAKSAAALKSKKCRTWNIEKCCNSLTEEEVDAIAVCYNFKIDDFVDGKAEKSALVVLNSYGYGLRSLVEYKYKSEYLKHILGFEKNVDYKSTEYKPISSVMARTALDIYAPSYMYYYIKLHPNDPELTAEQIHYYYGEVAETFTSMPFELLDRLFKFKNIKMGALLTFAHNVKEFSCNNLIVLGDKYRFTWFFYSSLYIAVIYAARSNFKGIYCTIDLKEQIEHIANALNINNIKVCETNYAYGGKINGIKDALFLFNVLDTDNGLVEPLIRAVDKSSAICFINTGLNEFFFSKEDMFNFVSINIKKQAKGYMTFNRERNETLWVYSHSRMHRDSALNFEYTVDMPHSGYTLYVERHNIVDSDNEFIYRASLYTNRLLLNRLDKYETILKAVTKANDNEYIKVALQKCDDLFCYIQLLALIKNNYIVALAVKDTPGDNLSSEIIGEIHALGFRGFTSELWRTYVGVIDNGNCVCDLLNKAREEPVSFSCADLASGCNIQISSMAWRHGNKAEIIIDNIDYAVNMRGINIVVFDASKKQLIDSVAFDYHISEKCYRK